MTKTNELFENVIEIDEELPKPPPWEPPKRELELKTTELSEEEEKKSKTEEVGEVTSDYAIYFI